MSGKRPYVRKKPGDRFGKRILVSFLGNGRWLVRCDCGNESSVASGFVSRSLSCGKGQCNSQATTTPTYARAHARVYEAKGPAKEHACVDCGVPAAEWSYVGGDPNELISPRGWRYSPDPSWYQPRCIPCHRQHDRIIRETGGAVRRKGKS